MTKNKKIKNNNLNKTVLENDSDIFIDKSWLEYVSKDFEQKKEEPIPVNLNVEFQDNRFFEKEEPVPVNLVSETVEPKINKMDWQSEWKKPMSHSVIDFTGFGDMVKKVKAEKTKKQDEVKTEGDNYQYINPYAKVFEPVPVLNNNNEDEEDCFNDLENEDDDDENEDEEKVPNSKIPTLKRFPLDGRLIDANNIRLKPIMNVTIGSDFEVFLFDNLKKEVVNAAPYVKGTKYEPFNFDPSSPFWSTSLDNVLAEGNIPPCKTAQEFNDNIEYVLQYIQSTLPPNIGIINEPAVKMKSEYLNTPESKEFGCTPSLNAYTEFENKSPKGSKTNLRTGAFHIHIKYDNMNFNSTIGLIKCMDLYLGLPSLLLEPPNERRQLYGTAGEFRFHPEKTTEYRVLSTYFCKDKYLRKWAFQNTLLAIDFYNSDRGRSFLATKEPLTIQETIQKSDRLVAELIIKKHNIPLYLDVA